MPAETPYPFLAACRRERVPFTPVWLMRQAGRYMKEYRAFREKYSFLEMCKTPELAARITLMPVDQFGVDAAIIFADIPLPLEGMGIELRFSEGEGSVVDTPVRSEEDIERLRVFEPHEDVPFVLDAIGQVRKELEGRVPLIGFSAAPFTLASYLVEGGRSRSFVRTKTLMYQNPAAWHRLMETLTRVTTRYVRSQVEAGAQAIQVFDTWVGSLGPADYEAFVLPYLRQVFQGLGLDVPLIHFATNTSGILGLMREAGGDVIGLDWRIDLGKAWNEIGHNVGVQGNLDPAVLLAPPQKIREAVRSILAAAGNRPGHIFNLGH
ncbi:MAG: uroporphyrinogen decarboxylase, partial [Deltaproteobacteria bacterium]|nr:uroporphyrinogen decarboxylase [Deltaproteobacteria bacterium]